MSIPLYQCLVFGAPSDVQYTALKATLASAVSDFALTLGVEVTLSKGFGTSFSETAATVAVFFGDAGAKLDEYPELLRHGIPIVPLVTSIKRVGDELPDCLKPINALPLAASDPDLVKPTVVALQCLGLLPHQRRVFLSYRRDDSRDAAVQLFEALSSRQFEVFLDTHVVPPAAAFQSVLWHRLCDSDVVVMLDTPGYFDSRWTTKEWGRAIDKHIAILQLVWPRHVPSRFSALATRLSLTDADFAGTRLTEDAIDRAALQIEQLRSKSIAVRHANIAGSVRSAVEAMGGSVEGVGQRRSIVLKLGSGAPLVAYPSVGVPTAVTLHEAVQDDDPRPGVVVYDHVGLTDEWMTHIEWLGQNFTTVRWIKSREAGWEFADLPGA